MIKSRKAQRIWNGSNFKIQRDKENNKMNLTDYLALEEYGALISDNWLRFKTNLIEPDWSKEEIDKEDDDLSDIKENHRNFFAFNKII